MLPLTATRLTLDGDAIRGEAVGDLYAVARHHLSAGVGGLVILGAFGYGKSTLCGALAGPHVTVVPLRTVAEHGSVDAGLAAVVGRQRLQEAQRGQRVLLLDGLDEVPNPGACTPNGDGFPAFFDALTRAVGPHWLLTSRPGHLRTNVSTDPEQVDVFAREDISLLRIDPLSPAVSAAAVARLPRGDRLLRGVEGLSELAASPLLLSVITAAAAHIDPGRPIQAWGIFDAWLRLALDTGPGHAHALATLRRLAWDAFADGGWRHRAPSFSRETLRDAHLPPSLRSALFVTDLDGRHRFGHRAVYEHLLAEVIAPQLRANQGHGPDGLTGLTITDATRAFLVGRVGTMPTVRDGDRTRIPRGNFIAGGEVSADERPLRIAHVDRPYWIARTPVTHQDWRAFLKAHPDPRVDARYLPHWGPARVMPEALAQAPVYSVWPNDADRYAASVHARLPTANEWEKAARGLDGRRYPWGDWWRAGLGVTAETGLTQPIGVRALGSHGDAALFTASGGVFEYTSSAWRDRDDRGRVVMGGCFSHPATTARSSLRLSHKVSGHLKAGLRLAWDA